MFSQVYFHRIRRIFDFHVGQALKEVLINSGQTDGLFPDPARASTLEKYMDYDDWKIFGALKDKRGGRHGEIILKREPYKFIL